MKSEVRGVIEGVIVLWTIISVVLGAVFIVVYAFTSNVHTAIIGLILIVNALLWDGASK